MGNIFKWLSGLTCNTSAHQSKFLYSNTFLLILHHGFWTTVLLGYLWPPYRVGQAIIFLQCGFYPSLFLLFAFTASTLLVGRQEGHPACNKTGDGGGRHWLVRMEWCPSGWSVCPPLLIFPCSVKSRSSLLAPAHPGSPRKGP